MLFTLAGQCPHCGPHIRGQVGQAVEPGSCRRFSKKPFSARQGSARYWLAPWPRHQRNDELRTRNNLVGEFELVIQVLSSCARPGSPPAYKRLYSGLCVQVGIQKALFCRVRCDLLNVRASHILEPRGQAGRRVSKAVHRVV